MTFNLIIRNARQKRGITQKELADHFGFTVQFVSNIENGKSYLPSGCFDKFCKKLHVDTSLAFNVMLEEILDKKENQMREAFKVRV